MYKKWSKSDKSFILSLSTAELECLFITMSIFFYFIAIITFVGLLNEKYYGDTSTLHLGGTLVIQMIYNLLYTLTFGRVSEYALKRSYHDLALKRTFVRHVSHEIRTPLNIVLVGIDLIRKQAVKLSSAHHSSTYHHHHPTTITTTTMKDHHDSTAAATETLELVEEINDSCRVAISILDDLLTYEKLDAGLFVLDCEKVNIGRFLQDTASLFRLQLLGKELTLNLLSKSEMQVCNTALIDIDQPKMAQVMRNFLSNAIKFTPAGGVIDFDIELSTASLNVANVCQTVLIKVTDSGVGVSQENVRRIFNEVIQFNANQLQAGGGSGLGLFISRGIVELHGGKVRAHSDGLGKGCTFTIELPVYFSTVSVGEAVGGSHLPSSWPISLTATSSKARSSGIEMGPKKLSRHVLVVDDSHMNRKMVGRLLTSLGHTFDAADDGAVCVEKVRSSIQSGGEMCYDAVLIDHQMPTPGPEATRQLRSLGFEGAVIGVTGNCAQEDLDEFKAAGADIVLKKPVTGEDIEHTLREYCKVIKRRT